MYGPESQYANCKKPWNPQGDGLTEEDIPFPVFYTDNATSRDPLLKVSKLFQMGLDGRFVFLLPLLCVCVLDIFKCRYNNLTTVSILKLA